MIRQLFGDHGELIDGKGFVGKNIINPQRGQPGKGLRLTAEIRFSKAGAFFQESVLHIFPDREIGIRIRNIIEVAAYNGRMFGLFNFKSHDISLLPPVVKTHSAFS